ncbi:P-loop containing nucleoside triphosphate hydrolase protein [Plectosphaerella plurivora]|uniref:RNA helicase n=1 Tax=Plectosphaerella plurivora TaxID=936078 RepID=A0A9P9AG44_9PEZI|nr:P-loop containing nucleoside triphosphate hydrolase protein [Plectosphaerella plurivora]
MDILKVLSRGIKQPGKGAKQPAKGPTNLPSAGTRTNPQLFHDDVPSSRGSKRKRSKDEPERADEDADLPEVDFFAPKKNTAEDAADDGEDVGAATASTAQPEVPLKKPKLLSEDECRQLLRSHRLKLTLLSSRRKESKVTKSKKKKKAVEVKEDALQVHSQPLHSFQELRSLYGISDTLAANLHNESYRVPTEVQLGSLPLLLQPKTALKKVANKAELGDFSSGIDFLAVAPTGSGKTVSFLIPAIDGVLRRKAEDSSVSEPRLTTIIVAPTRELVFQIVNEGRKLVVGTGVKVAGFRKGTRLMEDEEETVAVEKPEGDESEKEDDEDIAEEPEEETETALEEVDEDKASAAAASDDEDDISSEDEVRRKNVPRRVITADILVTTPAMLHQYLVSGPEDTRKTLPNVRSLILDEADILLDPLFRDMTRGVWSACTNPSLRTSFWSATMGSNIETIARDMLASRPSPSPAPLVRLVVGLKDTAVPNITHKLIYTASEPGKLLALRQLLHPNSADGTGPPLRPPFIVFTQTIPRATALEEELKYDIPLSAGGTDRIAALHSGLTDTARASIMRRFRAGDIWVLITTDLLARGVDFAGVNGIVNYDIPGSTAAYVHRAGRTGRAGREGGVAVTFYTKDDIPFAKTVANVIALSDKQAGKTGDDAAIQPWLLDALPDVTKDDRKRLKERGVESRRTGNSASKITSQSGWERRRENNRQAAIEGSKKRQKEARRARASGGGGADEEWGGIDG